MNLRCKPGDLCLIIKSRAGNEGKCVTVLEFVGTDKNNIGDDLWRIDKILLTNRGIPVNTHRDSWLMPINPSQDQFKEEYLSLTKKTPEKV